MESLRLNPLDPDRYLTYGNVGLTLMILQRYGESAEWFEKSLMANPDAPVAIRAQRTYLLAAVYASAGQPERARVALTKAQLLWPYTTVRFIAPETRNATYIAQLAQIRDEFARIGIRDHADEDEDRGVPSDKELHAELFGYTPPLCLVPRQSGLVNSEPSLLTASQS
jgi:tetratricopeptide (TPR) repeat protein